MRIAYIVAATITTAAIAAPPIQLQILQPPQTTPPVTVTELGFTTDPDSYTALVRPQGSTTSTPSRLALWTEHSFEYVSRQSTETRDFSVTRIEYASSTRIIYQIPGDLIEARKLSDVWAHRSLFKAAGIEPTRSFIITHQGKLVWQDTIDPTVYRILRTAPKPTLKQGYSSEILIDLAPIFGPATRPTLFDVLTDESFLVAAGDALYHVRGNAVTRNVPSPAILGYEAFTLPGNHSGGVYFIGDGALGDVLGWIPLTDTATPGFFTTVAEPTRLWNPAVGPNGRVLYIQQIDRDDSTGYYALRAGPDPDQEILRSQSPILSQRLVIIRSITLNARDQAIINLSLEPDTEDSYFNGQPVDLNFQRVLLTLCPADMNRDTIFDNGDINAFVQAYLAGSLRADFTNDGLLDNGDIGEFVSQFLNAVSAGCG